jgi:ribonuclease BN (tRNA processing enzyme)
MELTFLGTGAAFARDAFNAGYVLDRRVLVDAGNPAHLLLARTGHDFGALDAAVISHQHADHTFGLPFVLASRAIYAPDAPPFTVAGPPGFTDYVGRLLRVAWGSKLHDLVHERLRPNFIEIRPGDDLDIAGFKVHAEEVVHVPDIPCQGYVFEKDGVRFGFSGDSGECPGLLRLIERSDYFLIEMTGPDNDPSHLSRRAVVELVETNPRVRFYITHLNQRDPVAGALLAEDLQTVELTARVEA